MKQAVVISSATCFGYCVSIIRQLHCAWLKLRMSLYVEIVQRQGLAVIFHVVRFSLQEPVMCGLVAGLRVSIFIVKE
jgi:ABC-type amino acid transport system permease subunit